MAAQAAIAPARVKVVRGAAAAVAVITVTIAAAAVIAAVAVALLPRLVLLQLLLRRAVALPPRPRRPALAPPLLPLLRLLRLRKLRRPLPRRRRRPRASSNQFTVGSPPCFGRAWLTGGEACRSSAGGQVECSPESSPCEILKAGPLNGSGFLYALTRVFSCQSSAAQLPVDTEYSVLSTVYNV
jgi:hypothetical protein